MSWQVCQNVSSTSTSREHTDRQIDLQPVGGKAAAKHYSTAWQIFVDIQRLTADPYLLWRNHWPPRYNTLARVYQPQSCELFSSRFVWWRAISMPEFLFLQFENQHWTWYGWVSTCCGPKSRGMWGAFLTPTQRSLVEFPASWTSTMSMVVLEKASQ